MAKVYTITNASNTGWLKNDTAKVRAVRRAKEWAGTLPEGTEVHVTDDATGDVVAIVRHRDGQVTAAVD